MTRNAGKRRIVAHVKIRCPNCESIQNAIEEELIGFPFLIYVHFCTECGYEITESEWNVVKREEVKA